MKGNWPQCAATPAIAFVSRPRLLSCKTVPTPKNNALIEAMKAAERAVIDAQRTDHIYGARDGAPPLAPWPTSPCRIVFLDFDGVLNCERSTQELGTRYRFAKSGIAALNTVLEQSGALVVITSTWREHWTLRENAEFLERDGLIRGRVVGKTPTLDQERGLEIDSWLHSVPYSITSYVILDDRDDMAMHRQRLIQVNPEVGLDQTQALRATELLAKPWSGKV
jgi:hypothetical protein